VTIHAGPYTTCDGDKPWWSLNNMWRWQSILVLTQHVTVTIHAGPYTTCDGDNPYWSLPNMW